ncbi:serine/threonine-protein phosphatase 7 long form homolog [Arachis ipaensis]|uniref:serine/threonine-protein phosphatase 7 long form homolog n=1 Tax=Arachis ipaensis TaxID=130454 RepID=UPI000A2B0F52|nr:serine/threonine-protein phosphatase 7 long form homolog [Arachis ipaensis]
MPLHDRIIPYLETAGLYHLARLNSQWFWVDESLLNAFIEQWRPETHTFHMPFGECTITLQDVAYQLGLSIDGVPVSGCLNEFENLMEHGRPAWVWFRELFGELPPQSKIKQMTVYYTWFHERFRVLPADATDETVRVYARAYILMLLSSQLFADKNANRVHLRWLPYLASLDELGRYSWGSAALAWLYRCLCRGTNRNVVNLAGPLQLLQSWIFWRFPTLRPTGFDRFGFPLASR